MGLSRKQTHQEAPENQYHWANMGYVAIRKISKQSFEKDNKLFLSLLNTMELMCGLGDNSILQLSQRMTRGVFRTLSNIYDGAFFLQAVHYFRKNAQSYV